MLMQKIATSDQPLVPSARASDPLALRSTFGCFASGVTVVTCAVENAPHGMTANSFISVSLEPARALVSIKKSAKMHQLLKTQDYFGLSVLSAQQAAVSAHFAGQRQSSFKPEFREVCNVPLIAGALAWMVCKRAQHVDIGDHTLFVGDLIDCDHGDADPLVFFGGKYAAIAPRSMDMRSMENSEGKGN